MNYYLDQEFIEGFHKPLFGKRRHYIDLISIGLVCEDGREYYAVSKDFDLKHVWNKYDTEWSGQLGEEPSKVYWLRENVLRPLHKDLCRRIAGDMKNQDYFYNLSTFSYKSLKSLISIYGKTNKQIAAEIQCFTSGFWNGRPGTYPEGHVSTENISHYVTQKNAEGDINFYGYYSAYDWVLFCSLFGRMLDLPKGYPMYCHDLKQLMDELSLTKEWKDDNVPAGNEHHALEDAKWNQKLHKMIKVYMAGLPQLINS